MALIQWSRSELTAPLFQTSMSASAILGACVATNARTRQALTIAAALRASGCLWMAGLVKVRIGHGRSAALATPLLYSQTPLEFSRQAFEGC